MAIFQPRYPTGHQMDYYPGQLFYAASDFPTPTYETSPGLQGSTDAQGNVLAFTIPDEQRLMRFLVLGSESGTFYATESALTEQNATCVTNLINSGHGEMVVEKVVEVVRGGRAIRLNSALLTLAMCCRSTDGKTKTAAYRALSEVCNIPTHLFKFIQYLESQGKTTGWGRGLRKAVSLWYNHFANNPQRLAMLVTKYRQRDGWTHRDILRLAHLKPVNDVIGFILRYTVKGLDEAKRYYLEDGHVDLDNNRMKPIVTYLDAVEEVRRLKPLKAKEGEEKMEEGREEEEDSAVQRAVTLIIRFDLLREHLPSCMLNEQVVWQSLLEKMPIMATIRNLPRLTTIGLLEESENVAKVVKKLGNKEAIKQSKVHPYSILVAWYTYRGGKGVKGHLHWRPVPEILDALEGAFYAAFANVTPTNKRILIALDVSGSMSWDQNPHTIITPRVGSAAMSMVTIAVEPNVDVVGFSSQLVPLNIRRDWTLDKVIHYIETIPMGGTDCSLPMLWAGDEQKEYDAFIIYTDNETWYSRMRPVDALQQYREKSGIQNARLATVGMTSGGFTVADPGDIYMMDVVGFDAQTPAALQQFISGSFCE